MISLFLLGIVLIVALGNMLNDSPRGKTWSPVEGSHELPPEPPHAA